MSEKNPADYLGEQQVWNLDVNQGESVLGCPNSLWGHPGRETWRPCPRKSPFSHFENVSNERENGRREKRKREKEKGRERMMGMTEGGKRKECFHVFLEPKFPHQEKRCHPKMD